MPACEMLYGPGQRVLSVLVVCKLVLEILQVCGLFVNLCLCDVHIPDICHRHHRHVCVKKLPGVNFHRFNAKNWHFRQILREKVAFFTDLTRKIGVFRCKL